MVRSRHGPAVSEEATTVVGGRPEVFHASCQWPPVTCAFVREKLTTSDDDDDGVPLSPEVERCYEHCNVPDQVDTHKMPEDIQRRMRPNSI